MDYLLAASLTLVVVNWSSIAIAAIRLRPKGEPAPAIASQPLVSIVIPVRGIESFTGQTLARAFALDWPDYELIFCAADESDPVVSVIREAMAAHPEVNSRLLLGDERVSANPKLNNCVKGWRSANAEWVILADSNVLMPPEYIQHLLAAWRPDTGLVCSTPLGSKPGDFWAEVECAFLNTHQARWQYTGEALGFGFAQGKSMLWNKPMLDSLGGIQLLGEEIAEDAAATKLVNRLGRKVHLVAWPFEQPLGRRSLSQIWSRQSRWARLRRVTFPLYFTPEILLGAMPPLVLALMAAAQWSANIVFVAGAIVAAIYLPEIGLAALKRWPLSWRTPAALLARDLIMPLVWMRSWLSGSFEWRGNTMTIGTESSELEQVPAV